MPADEPIVRIENVVKDFGPLRVLDGVGFDVARGQTVAVVGRSGSGKSTLLRCIAGLETIQAGTITVCGHDVGQPGSTARAPRSATPVTDRGRPSSQSPRSASA